MEKNLVGEPLVGFRKMGGGWEAIPPERDFAGLNERLPCKKFLILVSLVL
jgi:hypothetical protein